MAGVSVAVIGLGAAGIAALKNLKEEGYDVTGFDKNSYIGGLWRFTDSEHTSVLETTIVNVSKERGCFTDFPFPDSIPSYPTAAQLYQYLVDYANHFDLHPYCRLNTPIEIVTFDDKLEKWVVNIKNQQPLHFDKVVIATGGRATSPIMPVIPGLEQFTGTSIHAQKFKRAQPFVGKKVVVVGFGNSAADTATQLAGVAGKVYLSHRRGAAILPRYVNNRPADHTLSLRLFTIQSHCLRLFPVWGGQTFKGLLKKLQDKSWTLRPEWRFEPASSLPILSDTLVPCLEAGTVTSIHGVKRITGPRSLELDDGTVLDDVDAIVWCTGYRPDFSLVDPRFDPSKTDARSSVAWGSLPNMTGKCVFNLYLNVFSLDKPDSLAFLGNVVFPIGAFQVMDCSTMAIAQVWKNPSDPTAGPRLPSREAMEKQVQERFEWMRLQARCGHDWNVTPYSVDAAKWTQAMDHLGATGVNEYLGYGWRGWWFWVTNMRFCNLLMGGIWTPHVYRVFEGGRKRWKGARDAVEHVNRTVQNIDKKRA